MSDQARQEGLVDLLELLDLEPIEVNLFRGRSPDHGWQRVYGGQVLGQALVAASNTVEAADRSAHSLHAYFLRPGDVGLPLVYTVDRIRDGRSFTTRRVLAIQKGEAIFSMMVSFQVHEEGLEHQMDMPKVPAPEDLPTQDELLQRYAGDAPADFSRAQIPIEMRFIDPVNEFKPEPTPPRQSLWVKTTEEMPDDTRLHQCLLAYASDMTLLDTAVRPHGISYLQPNFQVASLDHAMWFHHPFRVDEWLLYVQESPSSGGARGLSRGDFFNRQGKLVASVAQEGLIRLHSEN